MADYGDILLEAVQTVVDGSLQKLQFDKTVICTITSTANAAKGEYTVNDGSTTFLAYSDNTEYALNTTVYVNIPNGDFSKQKLITGKYIGSSSDYYTYVAPWKRFVDITGDMVPDGNFTEKNSILANALVTGSKSDEQMHEVKLWSKKIDDGKNYTCIGLKADFKAWLSSLGAEFGTYGLRLYIRTVNKTTANKVGTYKTYTADLSTLDMIGNPYSFDSYYNQQKVFDISGMGQIDTLTLCLFQKNDFYDASYHLIEHTDPDGVNLTDNIFVDNIYLALGYSVEEFDGDMAMLYTLDSEMYSAAYGHEDERNVKHLMVRWIHKDEKGNIIGYTDSASVGEKARIHWYKYKLDQNVMDDLAGAFWEEILDFQDTFEQEIDCYEFASQPDVQYKVIIETPVKEYLLRDKGTDEAVAHITYKLETQTRIYEDAKEAYEYNETEVNRIRMEEAKAELDKITDEYNDITEQYTAAVNYIESDIVKFRNEQDVADLATLDLIQALTLKVDEDGYKGIYTLYDQTNQLQKSTEANTLRVIEANYRSTITGDTDLDSAESITWVIPLTNTMIYRPEDGKEFDSLVDDVSESEDGQFLWIKRDGKENAGTIGTSFEDSALQYFRIKNYFTESATNNTITCYVVKDQKTYEASANLQFGPMGTNGTDFTFVLKMESDRTCLFGQDTDPVRIDATLYDYNNNEVPHAKNAKITYSWYAKDDLDKIAFCQEDGTLLDSAGQPLEKLTNTTKLLRQYIPNVDANDTHLYCYVRLLTENEMRALRGSDEKVEYTAEDKIPFYYILSASLTIDATSDTKALGKTMLNTYLPIPYSSNYDYTQIAGTTKIIYNSAGTSPYYYKDGYVLYSYADPIDANRVIWDEKNAAKTLAESKFYPVIDEDGTIIPPSTFVNDLSKQVAAVCYERIGSEPGEIYWTQPILMIQDAYSSAMLNAWDGSLTIDEENGTIMSTMIGAGYKDKQNRYNGVLIGDVKGTADTAAGTGVFGYNTGVQSFGLKNDGTAFFGKAGKGQIQFDGNSGLIQSMSYKQGQSGMKIDLDDGIIDIRGNEVTKVVHQKKVEILEVADFTKDLTDIYALIDGKKIENDTTLNKQIALLQKYNEKPIEKWTDDEKADVTAALAYIQSVATEVRFKEESLDDFLTQFTEETNAQIKTQSDRMEALQNQIKILKNLGSPADLEDAEKLQAEWDALEASNNDLMSQLIALSRYALICEDMKSYKSAMVYKQFYSNYSQEVQSLSDQLTFANSDLQGLNSQKTKLEKEKNSLAAGDSEETNVINSEKEVYTEELVQLNSLITAKTAEINTLTSELTAAKANRNNTKKEYEKYLAAINIPNKDVSYADVVSPATQEAYYRLLETESISTELPTKIVNSTETEPVYKTVKSQVHISSESPYFKIVDVEGQPLMVVADNAYYLQSANYSTPNEADGTGGNGVRFDLKADKLNGYNFFLKSSLSEDDRLEDKQYNGSYVALGSKGTTSEPFLRVHYRENKMSGNNIVGINTDLHLLDITRNRFVIHSQNWKSGQDGLEIDVAKGSIRAFNDFNLKAVIGADDPDYVGSYVQLSSSGAPFFRVHYEKKDAQNPVNLNLIEISKKSFVLQSQDWKAGSSGLQFDLTRGALRAYNNFKLHAEGDQGSIDLSSTGSPFFQVTMKKANGTKQPLMYVANNDFYMQSQDWGESNKGLKFNLKDGKLTAYSFTIKAFKTAAQYISIDSSAETYPLQVIGGSDINFQVGWDGKVIANYITTVAGKIGPFYFDQDALYTGDKSLGGSGIYLGANAGFSVKSFQVDTLGTVTINGGGGSNAGITLNSTGTSDFGGSMHINGDLYISGKIIGNNWQVDQGEASGMGTSGAGGVAGFSNINAIGGSFGPWKIDEKGIYTDYSNLGAEGTLILQNNSNNGLSISSDSANIHYGDIKFEVSSHLAQMVRNDCAIKLFDNVAQMRSGSGWCEVIGGEEVELYYDGTHGFKATESYVSMTAGSNKFMLTTDNITIDNYTCKKEQTLNIISLIKNASNLKFYKGLLVSDIPADTDADDLIFTINRNLVVNGYIKALVPGGSEVNPQYLGKLAFADSVKKKITVSLSGKVNYSTSGGSAYYSGNIVKYIITDSDGKYLYISDSVVSGYNSTRINIPYSGYTSYSGSSGSKNVTFKKDFGEIEFLPSNETPTASETLTATGLTPS